MALENRRSSATDINKSLSDAGMKVSNQTVRRRLVPRKKPFLNAVQREKRLKWAKEHASWTVEACFVEWWDTHINFRQWWSMVPSPPARRRLHCWVHHCHHETPPQHYGVGMHVSRWCGTPAGAKWDGKCWEVCQRCPPIQVARIGSRYLRCRLAIYLPAGWCTIPYCKEMPILVQRK